MFTGLLLSTQILNKDKNILETYEKEIIDTFNNLKNIQRDVPIAHFDLIKN